MAPLILQGAGLEATASAQKLASDSGGAAGLGLVNRVYELLGLSSESDADAAEGDGADDSADGADGDASDSSDSSKKTAGKPISGDFCGLQIDEFLETVVDCSCCSMDVENYASQVEMEYGSGKTFARAFERKERKYVGQVPIWSIGGKVPQVICHRDMESHAHRAKSTPHAMCRCANEDGTWALFEPSCVAGDTCSPPKSQGFEAWSDKCAEGMPCPGRDEALHRGHFKEHQGAEEIGEEKVGKNGGPLQPIEESEKAEDRGQCTAFPEWFEKMDDKTGKKPARRVSLGESRCEDAHPDQCHLFFAKTADKKWKHCEASTNKVKQCRAQTRTGDEARARQNKMEDWAVKHAYTPGAWPVEVLEDGTFRAVKKPSREVFLKHVDELPKRVRAHHKL